jgi:choline kinase
MKDFRVLITTSGMGQRLGEITQYTNKSLVRIGRKPAISYIVEAYPKSTEYVVSVRHFAKQVKDFLTLAYPNRKFIFSEEPDIPEKGTAFSLGYSMLKAKKLLQLPFIFHACDTIITEKIPSPSINWNGGYKGGNASHYTSFKVLKNSILPIQDKGAIDYDYLHIGLVGINEYKKFWEALDELFKKNPQDTALNDTRAINIMLNKGSQFELKHFSLWHDIGNVESLEHARKQMDDGLKNLDKLGESIFIFDNFVIKFHKDEITIKNKIKRAKHLHKLVPKISGAKSNFYKYKFVPGELYSRVVTVKDFPNFLNWSKKNLWQKDNEVKGAQFKKLCLEFYKDKTESRIKQFLSQNSIKDTFDTINDEVIPPVNKLLNKVDWDWISDGLQTKIHGDLILDNVVKNLNDYKLIDWRQDFSGLLKTGDMYYDLAKLNHNLIVNHDIIHDNLFTVSRDSNQVNVDILRKNTLVLCRQKLFEFIDKEGLDAKKVGVLTSLIWLNMSPLHHYPFNLFLYYFGKLHLYESLKGLI